MKRKRRWKTIKEILWCTDCDCEVGFHPEDECGDVHGKLHKKARVQVEVK